MCGITGYVGSRGAVKTSLDNLKLLEYRGYDSAGVAFPNHQFIEICRRPGKIKNLEESLNGHHHEASVAVAHTRWATHGVPNETNAHPHNDCKSKIAVVHNGIIENYRELGDRLKLTGHTFTSDTDTEVIAHLIEEELPEDPSPADFVSATCRAIKQLRGAYALGIVSHYLPGMALVARKDSPMVIGIGQGENFLASDVLAVMNFTRDVIYLLEGDVALISADTVDLFDLDQQPLDRPIERVKHDMEVAVKGGYEHFMLKEIYEEPRTVRSTMLDRVTEDKRVVLPDVRFTEKDWGEINRVCIVGCGTAYHAGLVGKRIMEEMLRTPVEVHIASEFRYSDPILGPDTLTVLISQSGETADTLAALHEAKAKQSPTLAIVNVVGSRLDREADAVLYTQAGPEIGVASTKAYLAQLVALTLLALFRAQKSLGAEQREELVDALRKLPEQIESVLQRVSEIESLANALSEMSCFFYLGRGYDYAACMEAALKMKEISYIHAEAFAAGEMKHGPLALVEKGVAIVGLCLQPETNDKMVSNLQEVKARSGTILTITIEGDQVPDGSQLNFAIPRTLPALMPVLSMVPLQLLAYYVAKAHGCEIDQPRNLAKSVTVE